MKVLLIKDAPGIGRIGQIKEVSDGHARNFLIPRGFATPATSGVVAKVNKESQEKQDKIAREEQKLKDLTHKLSKINLVIKGKASKDNLFAAIKEDQIAKAINQASHIEIDPALIIIDEPIKKLGPTKIKIKLNSQHQAIINLNIEPQ